MKINLKDISNLLWPIERHELKIFLPMAFMMFCILFGFCCIRSIKDALVVPMIGSQAISFLKLWLVLPSSVLVTLLYVRISNLMSFEYVFYVITSTFLLFFFFFTFVIYPSEAYYHPDPVWIEQMAMAYPNFQWFIRIIGKWSYALCYLAAELWSVMLLNLMFWQFANHIFDSKCARRFYPMLALIGNFGLIAAGYMLSHLTSSEQVSSGDFSYLLKIAMGSVIILGIFLMITFYIVQHHLVESDEFKSQVQSRAKKSSKTKLPFLESILLVCRSKYIGHLVMLTICYGLLINILEGPWKDKLGQLYPNSNDYLSFMGSFNMYMGLSCVVFTLVGGHIVRSFSWLVAAMSTPIILCTTGFLFFIFVLMGDASKATGPTDLSLVYLNPLYMAVIVGAVQNIMSKATKYSLFDSSKEMAYIPLSGELRAKGKAAVEIVGMKFGKSLGSFIQSGIFILFPFATFDSISIYLFGTFLVISVIWFWNIFGLNTEYKKLVNSDGSMVEDSKPADEAADKEAVSENNKK